MKPSCALLQVAILTLPQLCAAAGVHMLPGSWQIEAKFEEAIEGKKSIRSETQETCFTKDILLSNPLLSPRPETIFDGQAAPCAHGYWFSLSPDL